MRAKGLWAMLVLLAGAWAIWQQSQAASGPADTGWARAAVAINDRNASALRRELRAGLDPNATDGATSLLMMAAWSGNADAAAALLAAGADVDRPSAVGVTPLMNAAQTGDEHTVKVLLDAGADVNAATDAGWTALLFAAGSGSERRVRLLLEAGADVSRRTEAGTSAADIAALNRHDGVVNLLALHQRRAGRACRP